MKGRGIARRGHVPPVYALVAPSHTALRGKRATVRLRKRSGAPGGNRRVDSDAEPRASLPHPVSALRGGSGWRRPSLCGQHLEALISREAWEEERWGHQTQGGKGTGRAGSNRRKQRNEVHEDGSARRPSHMHGTASSLATSPFSRSRKSLNKDGKPGCPSAVS